MANYPKCPRCGATGPIGSDVTNCACPPMSLPMTQPSPTPRRLFDEAGALAELRERGWRVAVHNDYRQHGEDFTFWLFTHPSGRWVKGEGATDEEALEEALAAARAGWPADRERADHAVAQHKAAQECYLTLQGHMATLTKTNKTLRKRADRAEARVRELEAALGKAATRFNHCAEMIAISFDASGTQRAERTIKAKHYALEALAALDRP